MDIFPILLELFVPLYCLYYSYRIKKHPPKLGEKGLGTKLAMQSQAAWDYANQYGSNLCLIFGVVTGLIFIVGRCFIIGLNTMNYVYSGVVMLIEFACVVSLIPLTNAAVKKKYGLTKQKNDNTKKKKK